MEAKQKYTSSKTWLLALLIGCAILIVRIISLRNVFGPVVYGDEFIYWRNMMALFVSHGSTNSGYPPLYPSFMALGLFWPDTYRGVLLLNAMVGSILPFVAWRISRKLPDAYRITAVVLLSVMPLLFVYPRMMMSENLFIPLIALTLWTLHYTVRHQSIGASIVTGILLWMACMTRYQGLFFVAGAAMAVSLPILLRWWPGKGRGWSAFQGKRLFAAAVLAGGIPLAGIMLWKWFGVPSSWEMLQTTTNIYRHNIELTLGNLAMWTVFYLSYGILCILPLLPALLHAGWQTVISKHRSPSNVAVLAFVLFSTGISLAVASRHSALVEYNHPDPSHIMGRYLIFLPALALLCLLVLPYFREPLDRRNRVLYLGLWLGSGLLGVLAYGTIIGGWFFKIPSWFIMTQPALDVFVYKTDVWVLVAAIIFGLLGLLPNRLPLLAALVIFFSIASVTSRSGSFNNADGPEAFSSCMEETLQEYPQGLIGFLNGSWFTEIHARYYLQFKGIDMQRVRFGEGFENPDVMAVIRMEPKEDPDHPAVFVSKTGTAVYVDRR